MTKINDAIYQTKIDLSEAIPLHVYLVKGTHYAVFIDSGVKALFPQLVALMAEAGVPDANLRFILHTHSHHDHIGCNAQLQDKTGCLIAAHPHYAVWHADFEQHYQQFARPFPHLVADTPALRDEVLSILDAPRPLDLHIDEGVTFDLGGGVTLSALGFPGHLLAEFGWYEASTHTLILGDAITGLNWGLFHSHLSVSLYRATLNKLRAFLDNHAVKQVLFAHFPPMTPAETGTLLQQAHQYIDDIEATMIRILAGQPTVTLEHLWTETCARMERMKEFRALNMVHAHVQDLLQRQLIREVEPEVYQLR